MSAKMSGVAWLCAARRLRVAGGRREGLVMAEDERWKPFAKARALIAPI